MECGAGDQFLLAKMLRGKDVKECMLMYVCGHVVLATSL